MIPGIIICGGAGVGKSTVARILEEQHGAVCLAMADPMKRMVKALFKFDDDQLWGSSEKRDLPVKADWEAALLECLYNPQMFDQLSRLFLSNTYEFRMDLERLVREQAKHWYHGIEETTPRALLNWIGTDWGRRVNPDLWGKHARKICRELLGGSHRYDRNVGLVEAHDAPPPNWVVITDGRFSNEIVEARMKGFAAVRLVCPQVTEERKEVSERVHTLPDHFFDYVLTNDHRVDKSLLDINVARLVGKLSEVERIG